jgi:prophage regulatory protein
MDTQSNTLTGEVSSKPVGIAEQYALKLLRIQEVNANTTLSKSCINLWVAQGRFPKPITLSSTVKVWRASDIADWIDQQAAKAEEEDRLQGPSGKPTTGRTNVPKSQKSKTVRGAGK